MSRLDQVTDIGFRIRKDFNSRSPIFCADSGGDSTSGIDGNSEVGFKKLTVLRNHALQAELRSTFLSDRSADETAAEFGHEVHRVRRDLGSRHHKITFIFPVGIVCDDDHATASYIGNHRRNGIKRRFHVGQCSIPSRPRQNREGA